MTAVTIDRFDEYFNRLHNRSPYPWQHRLAARAADGDWPGAIDLPTGCGKTACLDIAVFALACQASRLPSERTVPRRIFFCVNRRVIVGEAYERVRDIARKIWQAEQDGTGILADIAAALRTVAGAPGRRDVPPLDVLELRGAIYRDNRWARSITQPTIICTTLDQLGSRLLFRGYGISEGAAPIHAALIAYDSLILLDEAHISEPFRQTLNFVTRYASPERWAEQAIGVRPAVVVPMTATPPSDLAAERVIRLEHDDRSVTGLSNRLTVAKPAELRQVKDMAEAAVDAARELSSDRPVAVGIFVNRVATARKIYEALRREQTESPNKKQKIPADASVELVIGSMRPLDREEQAERVQSLVGPDRPAQSERTSVVVATQCLEVGADYDFDVLVTECASLDALRQRFGRLNRAGRGIPVRAVIMADRKDVKPDAKLDDEKPLDPIYGNALARTWNWLDERASEGTIDGRTVKQVDFGIDTFEELLRDQGTGEESLAQLLAPSASLNSPLMMPAYIDLWCQTAPRPVVPKVSLFIHGTRDGEPDVQVCWRADLADLVENDHVQANTHWCDIVALLPPTSAECMRVPLSRMRRWLKSEADGDDETGDMIGEPPRDAHPDGEKDRSTVRKAMLWRGIRKSELLGSVDDLKPGDTVVLPVRMGDARLLGYLPELYAGREGQHQVVRDRSETAFRRARDRAALRLHPALSGHLGPGFEALLATAASADQEPLRYDEWRAQLTAASEGLPEDHPLKQMLGDLADRKFGLRIAPYPDRRGVVLTSRKRIASARDWCLPALPATDDGEDETSLVEQERAVLLHDHTRHVVDAVQASVKALSLTLPTDLFTRAAELHDLGKADERFQAMLRRSDRTDAWLLAGVTSALWAKSDGVPQTPAQRREAQGRAGLPDRFRHEMLSVQLAQHGAQLPEDETARNLLLHLIAAHHGHARPFAPVIFDNELPSVTVNGLELNHDQRAALIPSDRLDSGVAERFWRLTRHYGWWGLAYLESVLRLADQQASAGEEAGTYNGELEEVAI